MMANLPSVGYLIDSLNILKVPDKKPIKSQPGEINAIIRTFDFLKFKINHEIKQNIPPRTIKPTLGNKVFAECWIKNN